MRKVVLAGVLLFGLAAPALADGVDPQAAADEAHLNEVVCKKQPPPVGSRIGEKTVCLTNREWQAKWAAAKRDSQAMQSSTIGAGGAGK
ncbi:hypothetical protein GCM10008941_37860 [Rhizomicrobium palustre]